MRRAAIRAFRTTAQCSVRCLGRFASTRPLLTFSLITPHQVRPRHILPSTPRPTPAISAPFSTFNTIRLRLPPRDLHKGDPLQASMALRRAAVAVAAALVGYSTYGTLYANQQGGPEIDAQSTMSPSSPNNGANRIDHYQSEDIPSRPVLVVGADELFTSTIFGEGPLSKEVDASGRRVLEMLTTDQATQLLRKNEQSYLVNRGQGVVRYDLVQLPSNDPIEDDHAEKIVEIPGLGPDDGSSDWMFWGVFDGHSGWTTSAKLRQSLINYVARELNGTYRAANQVPPSQDAIISAIKTGFLRLDYEIVHQSVEKVLQSNNQILGAEMLAPALSGSCALLSFYDARSKVLRVACTGDSRAVLGRRSPSGKWMAIPLSSDQTGSSPAEVTRMRALHPGEPNVIRNGRVLGGLEPTRAFGDAIYKWSREVSDNLRTRFFGRSSSVLLKTPPYVTAEPEVTEAKIKPENGDFLVMATDGLWEMLTNEEVVGLVGKWLENESSRADSIWSRLSGSRKSLPVETNGNSGTSEGQKTPIRLQQWGVSSDQKDRFVVKDKNVATHLVRNALGGTNEEQVTALLTLPSPYSRRYRDDLTVQVVFFGTAGQNTGDVVVNREATAPSQTRLKAKL